MAHFDPRTTRLCCLAVVCVCALLPGCGSRTEPLVGDPYDVALLDQGGLGDGGPESAPCRRCTTQTPECSYCAVQGTDATWVCQLGNGAPAKGCYNLKESYSNSKGWKFTCFYCL